MKLSEDLIRATPTPARKVVKLGDGDGLFLAVQANGARLWRLRWRRDRHDYTHSLGAYPAVSLAAARGLAEDARKVIKTGANPAKVQRAKREAIQDARELTFGRVGLEWLAHDQTKAPATASKHEWLIEALRPLHARPLVDIKPSDVRAVVQAIQARGTTEKARRAGQIAAEVFSYAIGAYDHLGNPAADRKKWLKPKEEQHHSGLTEPARVGALMRAIDEGTFDMTATVYNALRLVALTFVRQGELRGALWTEIDVERAEWKISKERMKGKLSKRRPHVVPLSRQALAVLEAQRAESGDGALIFPHARRARRSMSDGALNNALATIGYTSDVQTPHGFRTTFSSLARDELRADSELVERQLSHKVGDATAGAYDRSQRLDERRALMQSYADLLDRLKALPVHPYSRVTVDA